MQKVILTYREINKRGKIRDRLFLIDMTVSDFMKKFGLCKNERLVIK